MRILNAVGVVLLAGMVVFGSVARTEAILSLSLDDQVTAGIDKLIFDNGSGDMNPVIGAIVFVGGLSGTPWVINVSAALGNPLLGNSPESLEISLSSVNISNGAGALIVSALDAGLSLLPGLASVESAVAGATSGTLAAGHAVIPGFGLGFQGPFGPGVFSDTATGTFIHPGGLVTLNETVLISHSGAGATAFHFNTNVAVPAPVTAVLLGSGLLGLAILGYGRGR